MSAFRHVKKRQNTRSQRRFIVCTTTLCSSLPRLRDGMTMLDPNRCPEHEGHDMATARQLPVDVYPETLSRLPPLKRETLNKAQQKAYDAVAAPRSGRLNLAGLKGPAE